MPVPDERRAAAGAGGAAVVGLGQGEPWGRGRGRARAVLLGLTTQLGCLGTPTHYFNHHGEGATLRVTQKERRHPLPVSPAVLKQLCNQ